MSDLLFLVSRSALAVMSLICLAEATTKRGRAFWASLVLLFVTNCVDTVVELGRDDVPAAMVVWLVVASVIAFSWRDAGEYGA